MKIILLITFVVVLHQDHLDRLPPRLHPQKFRLYQEVVSLLLLKLFFSNLLVKASDPWNIRYIFVTLQQVHVKIIYRYFLQPNMHTRHLPYCIFIIAIILQFNDVFLFSLNCKWESSLLHKKAIKFWKSAIKYLKQYKNWYTFSLLLFKGIFVSWKRLTTARDSSVIELNLLKWSLGVSKYLGIVSIFLPCAFRKLVGTDTYLPGTPWNHSKVR